MTFRALRCECGCEDYDHEPEEDRFGVCLACPCSGFRLRRATPAERDVSPAAEERVGQARAT